MATSIDGLCGLCPLAAWRPSIETGQRLMAAGCGDQSAGFRGKSRDGFVERGALPLALRPLVLGGATGFVCAAGPI
jgi:hypothetical protein